MALLAEFHRADARVAVIDLSRNFGKEVAMTAGLDHAGGDAVVLIDADLQDPPELIPGDGARVAGRPRRRADAPPQPRAGKLAQEGDRARVLPRDRHASARSTSRRTSAISGSCRARAVAALRRFPERSRFMKGLFAWIGFPCREIEYDRDGRYAGETKWNYWRLWNFALEGITSFSVVPLKIASYVGLPRRARRVRARRLDHRQDADLRRSGAGYPTLMVVVLFLGGLQLMALGVIGEYLARMFIEVKQRPLYLVQRRLPPARPLAARDGPAAARAA